MEGLDTLGTGSGAQKVMKDVGDKKDRFSLGIIHKREIEVKG